MRAASRSGQRAPRTTTRKSDAMHIHVAIDGPVASGKTTVARLVSEKLGSLYLDTGAMYRAVALLALREGIELDNEPAVLELVRDNAVHVEPDHTGELGYRIYAGGVELGEELFAMEVSAVVSTIAAHQGVRQELTEQQRAIAAKGPVVMAGRDIGTVVLPLAPVKIFLTASVEARVERRLEEYRSHGGHPDAEHVRRQIQERDRLDESRARSPLKPAADAVAIDSSELSPEQVVQQILALVRATDLS